MTAAAPSGVVTFLFTDVEGSTRRWEADADGMRKALAAHDNALRSAIEANEGFVFSTTGDGMVAAFSSPRSAVDAAIAAQRALELPVRMGLATGEAELSLNPWMGRRFDRRVNSENALWPGIIRVLRSYLSTVREGTFDALIVYVDRRLGGV